MIELVNAGTRFERRKVSHQYVVWFDVHVEHVPAVEVHQPTQRIFDYL